MGNKQVLLVIHLIYYLEFCTRSDTDKLGFLTSNPSRDNKHIFLELFSRVLHNNKRMVMEKRRILSMISDQFTYAELERNLLVKIHLFFT